MFRVLRASHAFGRGHQLGPAADCEVACNYTLTLQCLSRSERQAAGRRGVQRAAAGDVEDCVAADIGTRAQGQGGDRDHPGIRDGPVAQRQGVHGDVARRQIPGRLHVQPTAGQVKGAAAAAVIDESPDANLATAKVQRAGAGAGAASIPSQAHVVGNDQRPGAGHGEHTHGAARTAGLLVADFEGVDANRALLKCKPSRRGGTTGSAAGIVASAHINGVSHLRIHASTGKVSNAGEADTRVAGVVVVPDYPVAHRPGPSRVPENYGGIDQAGREGRAFRCTFCGRCRCHSRH